MGEFSQIQRQIINIDKDKDKEKDNVKDSDKDSDKFSARIKRTGVQFSPVANCNDDFDDEEDSDGGE